VEEGKTRDWIPYWVIGIALAMLFIFLIVRKAVFDQSQTHSTAQALLLTQGAETPYSKYIDFSDNDLISFSFFYRPCSGRGQQVILKTDPITFHRQSVPSIVFDRAAPPNAAIYKVRGQDWMGNVESKGKLAVLLKSAEQGPPTPKNYWKVRLMGGVDTSNGYNSGERIPVVKFEGYLGAGTDLSHLEPLSPNDYAEHNYTPCKDSLSAFFELAP
jgi:hypothetical protein